MSFPIGARVILKNKRRYVREAVRVGDEGIVTDSRGRPENKIYGYVQFDNGYWTSRAVYWSDLELLDESTAYIPEDWS